MGVNFWIYLTNFYLFVTCIYLCNNEKARLLMMEIIQKPWGIISVDCKKIPKKVFKKFPWPSSWTVYLLLHNQGTIVCEYLDHFHPFCMQYWTPWECIPHSLFSMWRVTYTFDSRFARSDLCSRSLSSMIYLNYNE